MSASNLKTNAYVYNKLSWLAIAILSILAYAPFMIIQEQLMTSEIGANMYAGIIASYAPIIAILIAVCTGFNFAMNSNYHLLENGGFRQTSSFYLRMRFTRLLGITAGLFLFTYFLFVNLLLAVAIITFILVSKSATNRYVSKHLANKFQESWQNDRLEILHDEFEAAYDVFINMSGAYHKDISKEDELMHEKTASSRDENVIMRAIRYYHNCTIKFEITEDSVATVDLTSTQEATTTASSRSEAKANHNKTEDSKLASS